MRSFLRGVREQVMTNNGDATRSKRGRPFAQEMQQAFIDWMKKLPFVKGATAKDPEGGGAEESSGDQAPDPRPADSVADGKAPDGAGRNQ